MLSQLCVDAGFLPIAVDCFADQDTQALSLEAVKVNSLVFADIEPVLRDVMRRHGVRQLLYGSGFEHHPASLAMIEQDWRILGNGSVLFRRFQDKREFFNQLDRLGIHYPETSFSLPRMADNWLSKPVQGLGGLGVVPAGLVGEFDRNSYWQKRLDGDSYSALFVADGNDVMILGFNRQWSIAVDEYTPFMFSGIHNCARLPSNVWRLLANWLVRLLDVYQLRGLGSLDFIVQDGQCYVLEINPRIPASAQLYGRKVFALHRAACHGLLRRGRTLRVRPRGYQVVFAGAELQVPIINWPNWAVDLPAPGAIVGQGQPICSIIAGGKSAAQVRIRLQQRQQLIEHLLNIRTLKSHAIPSKRQ